MSFGRCFSEKRWGYLTSTVVLTCLPAGIGETPKSGSHQEAGNHPPPQRELQPLGAPKVALCIAVSHSPPQTCPPHWTLCVKNDLVWHLFFLGATTVVFSPSQIQFSFQRALLKENSIPNLSF